MSPNGPTAKHNPTPYNGPVDCHRPMAACISRPAGPRPAVARTLWLTGMLVYTMAANQIVAHLVPSKLELMWRNSACLQLRYDFAIVGGIPTTTLGTPAAHIYNGCRLRPNQMHFQTSQAEGGPALRSRILDMLADFAGTADA